MSKFEDYTPVIGLEIHVQLATQSKMFDRCSADWFGKEPNTVVGPLTLGLPGTLPVPNKKAIQWAILVGKALNCKTNKVSKFDRKHYFYPDLPKAFQLSQYDQPFSYDGYYEMTSRRTGKIKKVGITRAHLEEDTGKLIHKDDETLVDFNRAGVPLLEIVTEPDFDNSEDVKQFLEELQVIVRYLGVSEANMERGSMRLEPNISLKKPGQTDLPNYKVEVKNINSFNFAKRAVDFELKRHFDLLEKGETPVQETRGYNENKGITVSQRVKEEADDYRYMPEPDIPPFELSEEFLLDIEEMLPELPHQRIARYTDMQVSLENAYVITRSKNTADYFEGVTKVIEKKSGELVYKSPSLAAEIAKVIVNKKIKTDMPEEKFAQVFISMYQPDDTDMDALATVIDDVLAAHQAIVDQYKSGKENAINALVGQVIGRMQDQADARTVIEELKKKLSE